MAQKKKAIDKFQLVTDKIATLLEQGVKVWTKPWHSIPYGNLINGNQYSGINPLLCCIDTLVNDWSDPFFVGFGQAKQKKWKIKIILP